MGRVVSLTFGIIGRNLATVAIFALLISLVTVGLSFGVGLGLAMVLPANRVVAVGGGVGGLVGLLFNSIETGALTFVAVSDLNGQRAGIGRASAAGFRLVLPLIGLTIVMGLGIIAASFLLLVPGLMLAMRWAVAVPARVAEGPSVGRSLSRSAELTSGSRWRLFGLFVALMAFNLAINAAMGALGHALGSGAGTLAATMIASSGTVIGGAINTSISATGIAVCYMELRRIREGATPQQLASVFA